ncbi:DMT family transporter [Acidocella facilis]|uniref:DMT family transporter n=1 Tax=Acidocella facilis TaxID=525 RepID=UPI001F37D3E7|nr:DMT family transporter [Acidocella facilis]
MKDDIVRLGVFFAFFAALSNSTVGPLTKFAFRHGVTSDQLAFWRCLGAFLALTIIVTIVPGTYRKVALQGRNVWKIAICAFLGIFMLYHFETIALHYAPLPQVAFLVFSGGFGAIILDVVFLREKLGIWKVAAIFLVFVGGYLLIRDGSSQFSSPEGICFALLAGGGYASFMFFWKIFKLQSGLPEMWWFLASGALFLSIPYSISVPAIPSWSILPLVIALSLIPSLGGFFFTILALRSAHAHQTQVIESSEPVFSATFGAILFGEWLSPIGVLGSIMILAGAILMAVISRFGIASIVGDAEAKAHATPP